MSNRRLRRGHWGRWSPRRAVFGTRPRIRCQGSCPSRRSCSSVEVTGARNSKRQIALGGSVDWREAWMTELCSQGRLQTVISRETARRPQSAPAICSLALRRLCAGSEQLREGGKVHRLGQVAVEPGLRGRARPAPSPASAPPGRTSRTGRAVSPRRCPRPCPSPRLARHCPRARPSPDAAPALRVFGLEATFSTRATHRLPMALQPPPGEWKTEFTGMSNGLREEHRWCFDVSISRRPRPPASRQSGPAASYAGRRIYRSPPTSTPPRVRLGPPYP